MTTAIEKRQPFGLSTRPDFIETGTDGHDQIDAKDCRPPALRMAQSTSPETKRSKPDRFIDGLHEGELFNSLTREVYGDGEISFIIIRPLGHRNVEFDKDGKVVEFDVPDDDPRCAFTNGPDDTGKIVRKKPRATKFLDYLIQLELPDGRRPVMTLALKSTQLKKGMDMNMIIKGGTLPCYAYLFTSKPVPDGKGDRSWFSWQPFVPSWPSKEGYAAAKENFESFKDKKVELDVEEEAAAAAEPVGAAKTDDDTPF